MPHEMLTVKLCELDERIGRLHSRIYLSGFAQHDRIRSEIGELRQECEEADRGRRTIIRSFLRIRKTPGFTPRG